jgi:hypothetical protein
MVNANLLTCRSVLLLEKIEKRKDMRTIILALVFSALVVALYGQRYELRVIDKSDRAHVQIRNVNEKELRTSDNRVTDIVFGVKWRETGIQYLEVIPGSYKMTASGSVKEHQGYKFQAFGAMSTPYSMPVDWKKDAWVDIVVLKVHGTKAWNPKNGSRFSLAETGFDVTTNPNVGIDLVDDAPKIVGYQVTDGVIAPYAVLEKVEFDVKKYGPRHAHLSWGIEDPEIVSGYIVERKIGETEWQELAHLASEGQFVHVYVDENVYDGVKREEEVAYRVRVLTSGGNEQLSVERMLDFNAHKMIVQVYPNPATDKVGVDMTATVTDNDAFLEVYGRDGRLVYRHAIESGSVREQIDLAKANIESGSYTVHLVTGDQILDAQPLHVMR